MRRGLFHCAAQAHPLPNRVRIRSGGVGAHRGGEGEGFSPSVRRQARSLRGGKFAFASRRLPPHGHPSKLAPSFNTSNQRYFGRWAEACSLPVWPVEVEGVWDAPRRSLRLAIEESVKGRRSRGRVGGLKRSLKRVSAWS